MITTEYVYEALVLRWIDGDTVALQLVLIDKGFGVKEVFQPYRPHYRLMGIDTPELHPRHADFPDEAAREKEMDRAKEAKAFAEKYAPVGATVYVKTYLDKKGKFGRPLVDLFSEDDWDQGAGRNSLNHQLVENNLAVKADY